MSSLFNAVFFTALFVVLTVFADVFGFIAIQREEDVLVLVAIVMLAFAAFYLLSPTEVRKK